MNYKLIPTNIPLTDSLSLKIPFKEIEVIDKRLTSCTSIYYEDLDEIDCELMPPKPLAIVQSGITVRIGLAEIPIYNAVTQQKELTKFVNITLSSKLLKSRYFEGITKDTIKVLYDEFIAFNVFKCSYDTFLDSMASDVDICMNRYADTKEIFSDCLDVLYSQSGTKQKHLHKFYDSDSIGLQFRTRNSALPSLPFIKLYHKEIELLTKSAEFYNTYLSPEFALSLKNLTRIEVTIRNYKHKQRLYRYGILPNFKTLRELLHIPQTDLYNFIVFSINGYIETKPRVKAPNLSPTDHLLFELIQDAILRGQSAKTILNHSYSFKGSSDKTTPVAQSRMRSKINELLDLLIAKDVKIQSKILYNAHVHEYLTFLNLTV